MRSRLFYGFLGTVLVGGAAIAGPEAIPVQAFFAFPQYTDVKISPDGHYLAVVGRNPKDETKTQLYFLDLADMQVIGHYTLLGEQQIWQLWWVGDRRVVFTTVTQTGSLDQPLLTGDIWAINVDGGNLQTLAYHLGKGVAYQYHYNYMLDPYSSDVGPNEIEIVDQIENAGTTGVVYKVNVNTAERHQVMMSPFLGADLTVDNSGAVRLAYGTNLKTALGKLLYRDADSVQWKDITSLIADEPLYTAVGPVMMTAAGKKFYYEGYTPQGTLGLYIVDPVTLDKTLLYSDPEYDIDNTFSSTKWLMSPDHHRLVAFEYMANRPTWILVHKNAPEAELLANLLSAFPGQDVLITSITSDGGQAVVLVSSDRDPGTYYLYDAGKHQLRFLFNTRPGISPDEMAAMRPVSFKARDGLTIHGYLTLPHGESKNLPLIINPHGGPFDIRDEWGFDPEVQFLAAHGYAVLQVEYRGSGGYGAAFQAAGYQQWGGKMEEDLFDATDWAIKQGIADPKRICIYGASYGGYAALEAVVEEPDLYRCAVGYAGVYDLVRMHDRADTLNGQLLGRFMHVAVGDDLASLKANSPIANAGKIKAALFLAHGGADHTVPIEQAEELRAALRRVGKQYAWLYYPNEGHGFFKLDHQVVFYTDMLNFLNQHIGPGVTAH